MLSAETLHPSEARTSHRATADRRIPELDGLRGLATLLILVWHFVAGVADTTQGWGLALRRTFNLTWTGVDLFFVLSGFLIGGIVLDQRGALNFFRVFYVRRSLRIIPLYYGVVFLFILALSLGIPARFPSMNELFDAPHSLWTYLTFTQNFAITHSGVWGPAWLGVTWSLAIEEQFYLFLPLVVRMVPPRALPWVLLGPILLAPLIRLALLQDHPLAWVPAYIWTPCRADALLAGVLAAWLVRQSAVREWLIHHGIVRRGILLVLFAGAAVLHQRVDSFGSAGMMGLGYSWIAASFFGLILVAVLDPNSVAARVGRLGMLRALGRISYAAYLFHVIVNSILHGLLLGQSPALRNAADAAVTGLAFIVTIGLAALSWHFFESRLVRLGHRLRYEATPGKPIVRQLH